VQQPWLFLASEICAVVAAAIAAVRLACLPADAAATVQSRAFSYRVRAMALGPGLVGVALFAVGGCLAVYGYRTVFPDSAGFTVPCCPYSQSNGYEQAADVLVPVVLAGCVLLAACARSRARSVAWPAVPATFLGNAIVFYAIDFVWSEQSLNGIGRIDHQIPPITIVPEPGYWLTTAGLAVLGLTAAPGADPYGVPAEPPAGAPPAGAPPASAASA
jgi:hypothetical protein